MDIWSMMQKHLDLMLGLAAVTVLLFVFVYEVNGFLILVKKAVGTVLQKLCALAIEAVCLIFKVINSLEIYVVLLIDAMTGKSTASGKIASLAIGVLSIASFYTTYSGMEGFIDQAPIAFLITLGIQAILLSTSLRINEIISFEKTSDSMRSMTALISLITLGIGCVIAYVLYVVELSYQMKKIVYHTLYLIVIVAILIVAFVMIGKLINLGTTNSNAGIFLFVIYFAVLSVSAFFSYNAFVPVLYPEDLRSNDIFHIYKVGMIDLLDNLNDKIDVAYYEDVREELAVELKKMEQKLSDIEEKTFLTDKERNLYDNRRKFEGYIALKDKLEQKEAEKVNEEKRWEILQSNIVINSKGIGQHTENLSHEREEEHKKKIEDIDSEIQQLEKEMSMIDDDIISNVEAYIEIQEKVNIAKKEIECTQQIDLINRFLKQDTWTEKEEKEFSLAVRKVEESRLQLKAFGSNGSADEPMNNFGDMVDVYHGYQIYRNQYSEKFTQILETATELESYEEAYQHIQVYAYDVLKNLPETSYNFKIEGGVLQTKNLQESDYYSVVEKLKRNANPNLGQVEKNIRTFINNKMMGCLCALMALLIDMMILFVGIIIPQGISFDNRSNGRYSDEDVKRILSNLFNKPIGR